MPRLDEPTNPITPTLKGLHLFHFDGAPCAQRVRFALGEKGLSRGREVKFDAHRPEAIAGESGRWVSRIVSLVKKHHLTPGYAQIHPNMVVPALVHDGTLYLESMDIIAYLDEAFSGAPLIPAEAALRAATWKRVEEAKVLHLSIRYVTFHWGLGRLAMLSAKERRDLKQVATRGDDGENLVSFYDAYSERAIPGLVFEGHLRKLFDAFQDLELPLGDGRQFLMSDDVSIADAFWAMKVLRLLECGYPFMERHPVLYAWYERVAQRPSFQNEVMGKNRLSHHLFRMKARVESAFGKGITRALDKIAA
ncbi:MAG: glutathione S-transferase family protein [Pseudomonadota bacterium]